MGYINEYVDKDVKGAYAERITYIREYIENGVDGDRLLSIPKYVTDMGIRKFESPNLLYKRVCVDNKVQFLSKEKILADCKNVNIKEFAKVLDFILLLTGEYLILEEAIEDRYEEIKLSSYYDTLLYSATILGALENEKALKLFEEAQKIEPIDQMCIVNHRKAAYVLKREKKLDKFYEYVNDLVFYQADLEQRLVALALMNNLFSLALLKEEMSPLEYNVSYLLLMNAQALCDTIIKSDEKEDVKSRVHRYRSQIMINQAQIMCKQGKQTEAVHCLSSNLRVVKIGAPEYLGEAHSVLQYALYIDQKYTESIEQGIKACKVFRAHGNVEALIVSLEIMASSYAKMEEYQKAEMKVKQIRRLKNEFS